MTVRLLALLALGISAYLFALESDRRWRCWL